ncbi:diaminopimelate decarboxylase [Butyrivibrio fibrisolvens DSM 3071]|uniref:Diaminopimelate decarboxylase n=1 Tax=Butyrivibrio fibrisolvens DSM 3071 TaxID=1121131 RepID=A0A1M6FA70_BUTFI|nr:hypothetical protein [Butyrivibrio fibrisolvens]SHI94580.1 diaminopimelate decarboxylase [Butyrivibrio fibrisolvens DSM 3071]
MIDNEEFKKIADEYATPSYIFNIDDLKKRVADIRQIVGDNIGLCYAMKANPFLTKAMSEVVDKLEVCSPGELDICVAEKIDGDKIVYSGVNKTKESIIDAFKAKAGIYTAESVLHANLLQEAAWEIKECGLICESNDDYLKEEKMASGSDDFFSDGFKVPVLLRLNAGSQFGMSREDICYILDHQDDYPNLEFVGIHYFAGTQRKKLKQQIEELEELHVFIEELRVKYSLPLRKLEYGPGLPVPYFEGEDFEDTLLPLKDLAPTLTEVSRWCDLTIEMGRFFTSTCGIYISKVMDIKSNKGTNYCIIDGGINHITYFGQVMGMKIPIMRHIEGDGQAVYGTVEGTADYALCGSLCTTADVLVRKVSFTNLKIGDILAFENIGAYSITEGLYLFLSRTMPKVLIYENGKVKVVRDFKDTSVLNH